MSLMDRGAIELMRKRRARAALGITPATDTSGAAGGPVALNKPITITALVVVALAIGGLVYLTEKDKGEP